MVTDVGRLRSAALRAEPPTASQAKPAAAIARAALNVTEGLFLDETGHVYPVTNWFDEDGDECPREIAAACVAGEGGCWFSLSIADFCETGSRA